MIIKLKKDRILKNIIFMTLIGLILCINVKASSIPYGWRTGTDYKNYVYVDSGKVNGAISYINNHEVVLILNNYNGDMITEFCYGTGVSDVSFLIILIGNNVINSTQTYGLLLESGNNISFEGNGTLTINAQKPISYLEDNDYYYINPSNNIYTSDKNIGTTKEENTTTSNIDDETEINSSNNDDSVEGTNNNKSTNCNNENDDVISNNYNQIITKILILLAIITVISIILNVVLLVKSKRKLSNN